MENKRLKKLMKVLRTLVYITFCCNLLALLAVPMLVLLSPKGAVEAGGCGLLFLVMSALFQQAAEMREEQELTVRGEGLGCRSL